MFALNLFSSLDKASNYEEETMTEPANEMPNSSQMIINKYQSIAVSGPISKWLERYNWIADDLKWREEQKKVFIHAYLSGEALDFMNWSVDSSLSYQEMQDKLIANFTKQEHMGIEYETLHANDFKNFSIFMEKKREAGKKAGISDDKYLDDVWNEVPIQFKSFNLCEKPTTVDDLRKKILRAEDLVKQANRSSTPKPSSSSWNPAKEEGYCGYCFIAKKVKMSNHTIENCRLAKFAMNCASKNFRRTNEKKFYNNNFNNRSESPNTNQQNRPHHFRNKEGYNQNKQQFQPKNQQQKQATNAERNTDVNMSEDNNN